MRGKSSDETVQNTIGQRVGDIFVLENYRPSKTGMNSGELKKLLWFGFGLVWFGSNPLEIKLINNVNYAL